MLSLRARVDQGPMAMKGILHSPKLQHYWNLTIRLFSVISRTLVGRSHPSAKMESEYSTAKAHWADLLRSNQWFKLKYLKSFIT